MRLTFTAKPSWCKRLKPLRYTPSHAGISTLGSTCGHSTVIDLFKHYIPSTAGNCG